MAALLTLSDCSPVQAQAGGSYSVAAYTGGTWVAKINGVATNPAPTNAYPTTYNAVTGYGAQPQVGGPPNTPLSLVGSGALAPAFTWQPAVAGAPPPSAVVVWQHCVVGYTTTAGGSATATFDAGSGAGSTVGDRYSGVTTPGASFTLSSADRLSPSVSLTGSSGTGGGFTGILVYEATASPVTINSVGATQDTNGQYHILIGQKCSATLNGIPGGCTTTNIHWTVSNWTVQPPSQPNSWNISAGSASATFSGPNVGYTWTQATSASTPPSWYWDDLAGKVTVSCTATVTPPAGQGAAFVVSATQTVMLDVPTYTSLRPTGVVELNTYNYNHPGIVYLGAGGGDNLAPVPEQANGITFQDTVLTPAIYSGIGTWYHVQLITISRYETKNGSNTAIGSLGNGITALDYSASGGIVYDQTLSADGTDIDPDNDNPGTGVSDAYQEYQINNESFQDYIMYTPPTKPGGNSIAVPLAYFSWQWNVDVKKLATASWSNWNDGATGGTITSAPTNSISRELIYPTWLSKRNLSWAPQ